MVKRAFFCLYLYSHQRGMFVEFEYSKYSGNSVRCSPAPASLVCYGVDYSLLERGKRTRGRPKGSQDRDKRDIPYSGPILKKRRLPKKRGRRQYTYRRCKELLYIREDQRRTSIAIATAHMQENAPALRADSLVSMLSYALIPTFSRARGIDQEILPNLVILYGYTQFKAKRYISTPDLIEFLNTTPGEVYRIMRTLESYGALLLITPDRDRRRTWADIKSGRAKANKFIISSIGVNLLCEWQDYIYQWHNNFNVNVSPFTPEKID